MRLGICAALCGFGLLLFRAVAAGDTASGPPPVRSEILALVDGERFVEAESLLRRLVFEAESKHGARSLELAHVLDLFVETRLKSGRAGHSETLDMARRALGIKESIDGLDREDVAASLHLLSLVLVANGHASAGNRHYRYMVEKREKDLGLDSPDVAATMDALALSLLDLGSPEDARPVLEKVLAIQRKSGAPSMAMARTLCLLSLCDRKQGDTSPARRQSEEAVSICEKALSGDECRLAVVLADWAGLLLRENAPSEARPLLERAIFLWEGKCGTGGLFTGRCAAALGEALQGEGNIAMARVSYERALTILDGAPDVDDRELAALLANLAGILSGAGEPSKAVTLYARSDSLYEKSAGPASLEGTRALVQKARALARSGNRSAAIRDALRADEQVRRSLQMVATALPENRALDMTPVRPSGLDVALSLAWANTEDRSLKSVFDAVIRNRALVLDEVAARYHTVREVESPGTVRLFDAFTAANREYARLVVKGAGAGREAQRELEARRRAREEAEAALAARSLVFRRARTRSTAGYPEVAASLTPGDALVSFVRFDREEFPEAERAPGSCYAALVIPAGERAPILVPLGEAAGIDDRVTAWKTEAATVPPDSLAPNENAYRSAGDALRRRVWDPIAEKTGDAKRVFIVPDGELHQISFAALPVGQDRYLLETGPVLHYLSAERDLVAAGLREHQGEDLLAIGAASFDSWVSDGPSAGSGRDTPAPLSASWTLPRPFRGPGPGCDGFDSVRFSPLPASRREIDDIAALWKETGESARSAIVLSGGEAGESAFKRAAPGMKILHLATHGFVLGGECLSGDPGTRGIGKMSRDDGPASGDSPLRLSGLALAGANHRMSAGPEEEDGILTAEEIAALDLSGVQWAVLSACDTGLGEVRTGEGVFGLRRAFEAAGVETLIMSLWAVEDDASSRWMKSLYEARLRMKLDTTRSVRYASLRMLEERRASGESTHPFFWGGFVAVGDWR